MYLAWHKRGERDPGLLWLRQVIQSITDQVNEDIQAHKQPLV